MITRMDNFVSHVAAHAGVSADRAERAARAVLAGIGACLSAPCRQLVASELPAELAADVLAGKERGIPIDERVREPGTAPGEARELMASVARVLAEELSAEALLAVRGRAPSVFAALLEPPARGAPPPARAAATGDRRATLAAGRPGSRHPVSEARARREQRGSIGAENPHADTKLSSAAGSTQERRRRTLAEGRPGSDRPIAGSRR